MSPHLKSLAALAAILVALQLPVLMIRGLTWDRMATRDAARDEVRQTWGGAQRITGPLLRVPFRADAGEGSVTFTPTTLQATGSIDTVSLRRGLFTVPTYSGNVLLRGYFSNWDTEPIGVGAEDLDWEQAQLIVRLANPRAIGSGAAVVWAGTPLEVLPGAPTDDGIDGGVHARPDVGPEGSATFEFHLGLQGSEAVHFAPLAAQSDVEIQGDWPSPSFTGSWLPTERDVSPSGFTASWSVPALGRGLPHVWSSDAAPSEAIEDAFGVALLDAVDAYRMAERSAKYAPLFLVLTFGMLWLFDAVAGIRVHPVQYVLVGAAVCLFYLLELSLSEHIGFVQAYALATVATAALVGAYTTVVLRAARRGALTGTAIAGLYSNLLLVLTLEQYALLAGSLALFGLLGVVMYLTRWVDWYELDGVG